MSDEAAAAPPARGRRRWIVGGLVLLVAVVLAVGLMNRGTPATPVPLVPEHQRAPAPEIALPVLQAGAGVGPAGAEVSLSDLRGRVVVLNVWASWCGECIDEVPVLERVGERYDPGRVVMLGLNSEDGIAHARRFLADHPFTYPSLRDPGAGSAKALGMWAYPATYIIDADGRVAATHVGAVEEAGQLEDPVDRLLSEG